MPDMKALFIAALTTFSAVFQIHAASKAATEDWVRQFVSTLKASVSNAPNETVYSVADNGDTLALVVEDFSVYALMTTNATAEAVALGVTNNMHFVWHEETHSYTNHGDSIVATPSNFVWRGIQSIGDSFSNRFDVVGRILQPKAAELLTR